MDSIILARHICFCEQPKLTFEHSLHNSCDSWVCYFKSLYPVSAWFKRTSRVLFDTYHEGCKLVFNIDVICEYSQCLTSNAEQPRTGTV